MKNKSFKIAFFVASFPTYSETFIINQIIDLINKGHQVYIFSSFENNIPIHPKIKEFNLLQKTVYIKSPTSLLKRFYLFFPIIIKAVSKNRLGILKTLNVFKYKFEAIKLSNLYKTAWILDEKDDFDIVHAHYGFMSEYYFLAKDCNFFKKAKLITTFHGCDMEFSEKEKNVKRYAKLFSENTFLTTNNEYAASQIRYIKNNYANIKLLPVGLDTNYYKPSTIVKAKKDIVEILYCGRFVPFKGGVELVEIANILINNYKITNVIFKIIGDGENDYKEKILNKVKQYELNNYFDFLGLLNQIEVIDIMNNSDIFILPGITDIKNKLDLYGRAETQGLVIQEAQAMKLPVIISSSGGAKYGIIPNKTGFVIKEMDTEEFCKALIKLIKNPELREKFGNEGRDYVVKNFDSKILGDKLLDIYKYLLEN